jgi:hypothetical protein
MDRLLKLGIDAEREKWPQLCQTPNTLFPLSGRCVAARQVRREVIDQFEYRLVLLAMIADTSEQVL